MRKVVKYTMLLLNAIAILCLLGAFFAPMFDPEKIAFFSFWGLIMPYILIVNVFFILFWMLNARFYFLASLLIIILAWSTVKTSFPYHKTETEPSAKTFSIMSYNVRVFDRYNWTERENNVPEMLTFIKKQNADILCLQEFGSSRKGITENYILQALGSYPYHYIYYTDNSAQKSHRTGLAIFSKYPIVKRGMKGDKNLIKGCSIFADITIDNLTYRIINSHYESIRLTNKYDIIKGIDSDNYKSRIIDAVSSYQAVSKQHAIHSNEIIELIEATNAPIILCADMNNSPVSYSYHTLSHQLDDAYLTLGRGFGATYNGKYPFLRIDYIMHSPILRVSEYKRKRVKYSDHFPITATFAIGN